MAGAILGMIPSIIDIASSAKRAKAENGGGAAANAGNTKQQPPRAAAGNAASGSGNAGQAAQMMQMFSQMMQQMMQMMRQMMTSRQGQPAAGAQTAPPPGQASSQPGQTPNGPPGAVMAPGQASGQRPTGPSSNLPNGTGPITNNAVNQNQGTAVANAGLRNQLPTSTTGGASLAPQGPNGLVPAGASGSIQSLISNAATTPPTGLQGVTTGPARLDGGPNGNFGAGGLASDIGISGGGCRTGNCPPNNFGGLSSSSAPSFPPLTSSLVGFNPLGINSIGGGLPGSTANAGNSGGISAGNSAIPPRSLMA